MDMKQTLSCNSCNASLPYANTPILTCQYCGTTMRNPFYQTSDGTPSSSNLAIPQINVIMNNVIETSQVVQSADSTTHDVYREHILPPPRDWLSTTLLALFLGLFGAHRFYTGHTLIGLVQLFTFGGLGLWTGVDILLLITNNYHDKYGRPIKSTGGLAFWMVVGLIFIFILLAIARNTP